MSGKDPNAEIDAIKADIANLREDMSELIQSLKERGKDKTDEVKDKARAQLDESIERLAEAYQAVKGQGTDFAEQTNKQIEQNPVMSVLTALGVGVLVGSLLSRK